MRNAALLWVMVGLIGVTTGGCPTTSQDLTGADLTTANAERAAPAAEPAEDASVSTPSQADGAVLPADDSSSARPTPVATAPLDEGTTDDDGTATETVAPEPPPASSPATEQPGEDDADPNDVGVAVDHMVRQFVAVGALFSAFGELGDPRLNLDPWTTVGWGTCPHVQIASDDINSLITLDFGQGCAAACSGGDRVIGENGEIYWRQGSPAAVYVVDGFVIDGRAVTPYLHHPGFVDPNMTVIMSADMTLGASGVTLAGPCDFATQGVGRAYGTVTLEIGREYVLTFSVADLAFDDGAQDLAAGFAGTVVRPASYWNFVPECGLATFTATLGDGSHVIEVEFIPQSPVDGTVNVSVDGAGQFPHRLPPDLL